MTEVLIFGLSMFSERIANFIEHGDSVKPFKIKGFIIDDAYYRAENFVGYKVYRYSETKENFAGKIPVIVCIGYKNMNENRRNIFSRLQADGWNIESYISKLATIFSEDIGIGNFFIGKTFIDVKCHIGDGNIFDNGHLNHHSTIGNFNFFSNNHASGNITMGDCCFIGTNSTLKNGITLHDKTLVGAGCYLNKSTPEQGLCYSAPKSILLGRSEIAIGYWTKNQNVKGGGLVALYIDFPPPIFKFEILRKSA